jgi:hypothetical protein
MTFSLSKKSSSSGVNHHAGMAQQWWQVGFQALFRGWNKKPAQLHSVIVSSTGKLRLQRNWTQDHMKLNEAIKIIIFLKTCLLNTTLFSLLCAKIDSENNSHYIYSKIWRLWGSCAKKDSLILDINFVCFWRLWLHHQHTLKKMPGFFRFYILQVYFQS